MYDGRKIVPGLILFMAVLLSPFLYSASTGQAATKPDLVKPTQEKSCVEPTDWMKANHMQLLIQWRDDFVRNGQATFVGSGGKKYDISLTGTCLKCHDKEKFCDRCHSYAGVQPNCWSCHTAPKES